MVDILQAGDDELIFGEMGEDAELDEQLYMVCHGLLVPRLT